MRHSVIAVLLLTCAALAFAPPSGARAESHALVEMYTDGPADEAFIRSHPGLDIAAAKPGISVHLVADADDLDLLEREGRRYRVLIADLETHYGSRFRDVGFGIYHTYSEAVAFVDSLRLLYPEVISEKWSLGWTHEGRDLWCFRVSANPDVDEDEPEILLDGMHHAREIMASEFCLMFPEYLAQNYGVDPEVTWLLDNRELYVVPIVNPDGVVYNESIAPNGGGMWRKNRRYNGNGIYGVDCNRNYPYHWGESGASPDPDDPTYRGPTAGSEPEVQAMMALINSHQFVTHQTVHTSGNLTLYPWGYTTAHTPDHDTFVHMSDIMTQYNGYAPGQPPDLLYPVSGGTFDWSYGAQDEHDKIFCFSNELGGSSDGFWPPESRRQPLFEENIWPMIYLMQVAGSYASAGSVVVADGEGGQLDPGDSGWLSFVVENPSVVSDLDGLQLTLASDDPYVQLGEAQRTIPSLPSFGSYDLAADPIPLTVDTACPDGHLVAVTAILHMPEGDLYATLSFMVGSPDVVFEDDFEGPGGAGAWQLTGSWGLTTASSHSPIYSLTDSPSGEYSDQTSTSATLAESFYATSLSFWHRYDIESGWDYGRVQISADGGPWSTLVSYTGYQGGWSQEEIDLADYAGQALRVRFLLETDYSVTEDGWYIDDVLLVGGGSANLAPASPELVAPADGAEVGVSPVLTVANSVDPDGSGPLTYGFRVYADPLLTEVVAAADGVSEGGGQTSWTAGPLAAGDYWWRAYAADPVERGLLGDTWGFTVGGATGVGDAIVTGPRLALLGTSGGGARLQLSLPTAAEVSVDVYDIRGARVRRLHRGPLSAGASVLVWNGRDDTGRATASGAYFVRVQTGRDVLTQRLVVVR